MSREGDAAAGQGDGLDAAAGCGAGSAAASSSAPSAPRARSAAGCRGGREKGAPAPNHPCRGCFQRMTSEWPRPVVLCAVPLAPNLHRSNPKENVSQTSWGRAACRSPFLGRSDELMAAALSSVRHGERDGSLHGARLAKSGLGPGGLGEGEGQALNVPGSPGRIAPENKFFSPQSGGQNPNPLLSV